MKCLLQHSKVYSKAVIMNHQERPQYNEVKYYFFYLEQLNELIISLLSTMCFIVLYVMVVMQQIYTVISLYYFLQANKKYLQKSVKEHEDNIREMLASRPKQLMYIVIINVIVCSTIGPILYHCDTNWTTTPSLL